jgi:hypothetical protein
MSKGDSNSYREGRVKDDSLRLLNLSFIVAITLAAIVIVYAYTSAGNSTLPFEVQEPPSLEGMQVQGQTLYEGLSSKVNEFIEWGMNLINSLKV